MLSGKKKEYFDRFMDHKLKTCKTCKGSGAPCECQDDILAEYRALVANIPVEHMGLTMKALTLPEIQAQKTLTQNFIKGLKTNLKDGRGLLLYGEGHGIGKTTLGCLILKAAIKQNLYKKEGFTAYFATLEDCVSWTGRGWKDADAQATFRTKILESDILLIDDVGGLETRTANNGQLIQSVLTTVVKERSNNLRSTIITSNLTPKQLESVFGSRLYSVLMQNLQFVEFDVQRDFRQEEQSQNADDIIKKAEPPTGFSIKRTI